MGKQHDHRLLAYLPAVLAATSFVAVVPVLLVLRLRTSGVVDSAWVGMAIGVATSFLASFLGGALWKTRPHSCDILFSDLMLWGWIQRWRHERRLCAAADLLGLTPGRPRAFGEQPTDEAKVAALTRLTSVLEARDPYTYGHSRRVARHAAATACKMGLSRSEVATVRAAGAVHDVGKLNTPPELLRKSGRLTDTEFAVIQRHPVDGAEMAGALEDPSLAAMVRHHHERLDGTGYPDGLSGDAIPLGARILAVADTFDAITSTRPYRHARSHRAALNVLSAEAGTQLDPDAVRAFCRCYSGRRPLVYWTMLVHARPRLTALLGGGLGPAQANTLGNVVATATAVATVGVGAVAVDLGSQAPTAAASAGVVAASAAPAAATSPVAWKTAAKAAWSPASPVAWSAAAATAGSAAPEPAARPGVRPATKPAARAAAKPAARSAAEPVAGAAKRPDRVAAATKKARRAGQSKTPKAKGRKQAAGTAAPAGAATQTPVATPSTPSTPAPAPAPNVTSPGPASTAPPAPKRDKRVRTPKVKDKSADETEPKAPNLPPAPPVATVAPVPSPAPPAASPEDEKHGDKDKDDRSGREEDRG